MVSSGQFKNNLRRNKYKNPGKERALRARPGFEPGTSRTLSENHTPRPPNLVRVSFVNVIVESNLLRTLYKSLACRIGKRLFKGLADLIRR
ncbi:hypothetical protein TNCT_19921 [Trichonephila clavata]|uniref:Uncharacterized protein n=1 Tax=Trichonephila clavata TaxID=2740835 RepID=A0A8X6HVG7_TRICU|nr:hypothetical protein TNCT_19921 [Trichonephila clavata]